MSRPDIANIEDTLNKLEWDLDDGIFLPMINDVARNNFYNDILREKAQDKIVCDIGSGTGLLSVLAVQHGAKKVYAVERDYHRARLCEYVVQELGLSDKITVWHGDFFKFNTDDVDFFISETIGSNIFEEGFLRIAQHCNLLNKPLYPDNIILSLGIYDNSSNYVFKNTKLTDFNPGIDIAYGFTDFINKLIRDKYSFNTQFLSDVQQKLAKNFPGLLFLKQLDSIDLHNPEIEYSVDITGFSVPVFAAITWTLVTDKHTLDCTNTNWSVPCIRLSGNKSRLVIKYKQDSNIWIINES